MMAAETHLNYRRNKEDNMNRLLGILLALALTVTLCACGKKSGTGWQEQYDLGVRYLSEGNYEEAVIAFTAAIEIDPKRPEAYLGRGGAYMGRGSDEENLTAAFADYETALELDDTNAEAYLGLAEVYIAREQFDEAMDILRQGVEKTGDQRLSDRLAELESGNVSDYWGRTLKETHYDGDGAVTCWYEYEYNEQGQCVGITSYGPDGSRIQHIDQRYDAQGHMIYGCYSWGNDGTMDGAAYTYNSEGMPEKMTLDSGESIVYAYDAAGRQIRRDGYDKDGTPTGYTISEYGDGYKQDNFYDADGTLNGYYVNLYNEQGQRVRYEHHEPDGTLTDYSIDVYDDAGNQIAWEHYDADGTLTSRDVYN